jgi:hypothetical protein
VRVSGKYARVRRSDFAGRSQESSLRPQSKRCVKHGNCNPRRHVQCKAPLHACILVAWAHGSCAIFSSCHGVLRTWLRPWRPVVPTCRSAGLARGPTCSKRQRACAAGSAGGHNLVPLRVRVRLPLRKPALGPTCDFCSSLWACGAQNVAYDLALGRDAVRRVDTAVPRQARSSSVSVIGNERRTTAETMANCLDGLGSFRYPVFGAHC